MLDLEPVLKNHGYFDDADPDPVLVVPEGKTRTLRMIGTEGPIRVEPDNPDLATFKVEHRNGDVAPYLAVTGRRFGMTGVWVHRGRNRFRLWVAVYAPHTIDVTFFFVTDQHGTPRTPPAQVDDEIDLLNSIYGPNANVHFRWHGTRHVPLDMDFSHRLNATQQRSMWMTLRMTASVGNEMRHLWHVFVVRRFDAADHGNFDVVGKNQFGVNMCLVDDSGLSDPTPVLAHECGHFFTLRHTDRAGDVMKQGPEKGSRLHWNQVVQLRRFLNGLDGD
jgi:hypothetical protein